MFMLCIDPAAAAMPEDFCLIYNDKNELLLGADGNLPVFGETRQADFPTQLAISGGNVRGSADCPLFLGILDGRSAWLAGVPGSVDGQAFTGPCHVWVPLRNHLADQTADWQELAFRGLHLFHWLKRMRFCGSCGTPLALVVREMAQACPACRAVWYPMISPAMIVAVTRNGGREILLAQGRNRTHNWYSLIAGFCEAGESVERTVEREVREETGIAIRNLRYVASQGWAFSQSLMLGFIAEWDSGVLRPNPEELDGATWFAVDDLPLVPPPPSIANRLIRQVVEEAGGA
jgi:NAD+ diphosphatase